MVCLSEIHDLVSSLCDVGECTDLLVQRTIDSHLFAVCRSANEQYAEDLMQEEGGVVLFVPLAQAANLPIIGNLGPKIPIRFHVVGNVQSTVESTIREFGVNNAYVEISILLQVNVQVIVPLASKITTVEQKIPVAMGLIQGQVPQIYNKGQDGAPSVEVPLKPEDK